MYLPYNPTWYRRVRRGAVAVGVVLAAFLAYRVILEIANVSVSSMQDTVHFGMFNVLVVALIVGILCTADMRDSSLYIREIHDRM